MKRKIELLLAFLLLSISCAFAQKLTVKGTVLDETGESIIGATVREKGVPSNGAQTDIDGHFTLTVNQGATLIFSYVGYKTKEVKAKAELTIKLEPDAQLLEGVTVETGYSKIDRRLFTGSAAKVDAKDALVDGNADISKMLQGKVAGVQVQNISGTFGAAPKIRVRGASSIYGNSTPLWVVDGVVLEDVVNVSADDLSSGNANTLLASAVAGLNANDIESFQILKDASATALYGARAMNGVVVITTKSGGAGKTNVTYSGEFTFRERPRYSDYNLLNSAEQMDIFKEMEQKGWLNYASTSRASNGGEFYVMSNLINHWDPESQSFGMPNTMDARLKFQEAAARRNTDWFGILFRPSMQQNHSVSISGGNKTTNFYGSLSLLYDPGWTVADKVNRYTANFNIGHKFSDDLTLKFATNQSYRTQVAPGTQNRSIDVTSGEVSRGFDINPFSYALNTTRTMRAYASDGVTPFYYQRNYAPFSILNELRENNILINQLDSKFQLQLDYNPIKQLELSVLGSARFVKTTTETRVSEKSSQAMAYRAAQDATVILNNQYLYVDPDNVDSYPEVVLPQGGFYDRDDNLMHSYYFRATANYNDTYDDTHIVNFLVGNEVKFADRQYSWSNGLGMQYSKGNSVFTNYKILKQLIEGGSNYFGMGNSYDRFVAFFATASYSYMGKATLNLTGRYDGSNLLGKAMSARWLPTWNASASWNLHETFFPTNRKVSTALIRGTFGLTASMGPARNSLPIFYNGRTFRGHSTYDESYIYISSLGNKNLTWEKQYETNLGLDLGFFNNRISFSGDIYWRKGFDLIGQVVTTGIGGQQFKTGNYANMDSHGFEFSLNTRNIETSDFGWRSNYTFSFNKNKITKLQNNARLWRMVQEYGTPLEGYSVRSIFSIPFAGLDSHGVPRFYLDEKRDNPTYQGIDFQQNSNLEFLKYEGTVDPSITGGMEQSFRYKGLELSLYFTYQAGNVIRLPYDFYSSYSDQYAMPREMLNRWRKAGDEKRVNIPAILDYRLYRELSEKGVGRAYSAFNYSDVRIAKGDFFRLKDVTLSYNIAPSWLKSWGSLSSAQVRFVASNLWLIYADKRLNGVDPEFANSGGVALPTPHQYTLTLRLGF